jgi:molecular chaperone GrpE
VPDDGAQEDGDNVNSTETTPDWETMYKEEQTKAETYLANWQRAQADMANVRRRAQQDKEEIIKFSTQTLVADLLPVLDSFDGALATIPDNLREQPWISGILQVERQLRSVLERQGLKQIEATGQPFDPTRHESTGHEETAEYPEDTVSAELRKGYTLNDRVLRPSMVRVATSP